MTQRGEWISSDSPASREFRRAIEDYRLGRMSEAVDRLASIEGMNPEAIAVSLANICVQGLHLTPEVVLASGGLGMAIAADEEPSDDELEGIAAAGALVIALVFGGADECVDTFRSMPTDVSSRAVNALFEIVAGLLADEDARDN